MARRAVRHRPQRGPHALADYIQQSVAALPPPEPPAPQKTRQRGPQKPHKSKAPVTAVAVQAVPRQQHVAAVRVRNLLGPEELEDDDEYADAVADLAPDFGRFGAVATVRVDRENGDVVVEFRDAAHAVACVKAKNRQMYGGRELVVELQEHSDALERATRGETMDSMVSPRGSTLETSLGDCSSPGGGATAAGNQLNDLQPTKRRKRRSKIKNAVVQARAKPSADSMDLAFVICNMVEAEEVEEDDEYEEAMTEVTASLGRYGEIRSVEIWREPGTGTGGDVGQRAGDVVVEYASEEAARAAFAAVHGSMYGGRTRTCAWISTLRALQDAVVVIVENMLDMDELEDDDEFREVCEEVEAFVKGALGRVVEEVTIDRATGQVKIYVQDEDTAHVAETTLSDKIYGGKKLVVRMHEPQSIPVVTQTASLTDSGAASRTLAPTSLVSEELVELLTGFLQRLASLQERAHIQNPLQDKRSRRLVLGLHEVRRGIQSNKIKLLVLATDFDACNVLDDKLGEIVEVATREDIPIISGLTRRKLGKVLKKHARVSCVGVYSYDGANEQFREIMIEHERLKRAANKAIPRTASS